MGRCSSTLTLPRGIMRWGIVFFPRITLHSRPSVPHRIGYPPLRQTSTSPPLKKYRSTKRINTFLGKNAHSALANTCGEAWSNLSPMMRTFNG